MSVNKVILVGNLGRDPEVRFAPSGTAIAKFPIATSERRPDGEGNWKDHTEWHNVVVFGKQAEHCGTYLQKGRQVYIEGSISTRQYDDKEGNRKYFTEIRAQRVQFLGGRGSGEGASAGQSSASESPGGDYGSEPTPAPAEDDVPF